MRKSIVSLAVGAVAIFAATGVQAQSWSAPTYVNWTGFYIGGQGTYRWSNADVDWGFDVPGVGTGESLNSDDWMGGVHGGVQQQFGQWVLGVDLSGDWGGSADSKNLSFAFDGITGNGNVSAGVDQIFTATGRLGYAWSNVMLYAKGGYASADVSAKGEGTITGLVGGVCDTGCSISTDKSHGGWTVGGGFDWMFAPNVSLGLDYNYIDIGSETFRFNPGTGFDDVAVRVNPDNIQTVSARLTLHFNSPREPAPYVPIK
jgi:outer membrane immunogenic protein